MYRYKRYKKIWADMFMSIYANIFAVYMIRYGLCRPYLCISVHICAYLCISVYIKQHLYMIRWATELRARATWRLCLSQVTESHTAKGNSLVNHQDRFGWHGQSRWANSWPRSWCPISTLHSCSSTILIACFFPVPGPAGLMETDDGVGPGIM